jgi:hypothetical protein
MALTIKTRGDALAWRARCARRSEIDPTLPVSDVQTMEQVTATRWRDLASRRFCLPCSR